MDDSFDDKNGLINDISAKGQEEMLLEMICEAAIEMPQDQIEIAVTYLKNLLDTSDK